MVDIWNDEKNAQVMIDLRADLFMSAHNSLFPETPFLDKPTFSNDPIFYYYAYDLLPWLDILNDGYTAYSGPGKIKYIIDYFVEFSNEIWLFYNLPIERFEEKLAAFMVGVDREADLSASDYALLFYSSLQDEAFKADLEGLPLPLLRDTLNPVIRDNLIAWMKAT
jgi:hypothetical protein